MLAFASGDPRFTLGTSHLGNDALSSIRIVTVADRQVHVVTAGTALDVSPLFTPDGRSLLFVSNRDGSRDVYHIAITRRGESRGNAHRLTSGLNAHSIDLSGDGRTLTYSAYSPYAHLWSEGGAVERVTTTTLQAANPEFSPDGNSIAFDEFGNGENLILVTTRSERGAPWSAARRIGAHAGGSDPSWSPDGRWVAYVLDGIRLVSPAGESDQLVVPRTSGPDGIGPVFAYWSADSRTLYYKGSDTRDRSSIWAVPVTGGTPRLLIRFDDPARPSTRREFATDGKRIYFSIGDQRSDLWLMELRAR